MVTQSQTIIVNCDTTQEVTDILERVNAWSLANPGQILTISSSGKKITVIAKPITVV